MTGVILASISLALSILGALLGVIWIVMASLLIVLATVWVVAFKPERTKLVLFLISLSVLYQVTLYTPYLVGTDLHLEYYYFQKALHGWNINLAHPFNASVLTSFIGPYITRILHIPGYWVFKVIFPIPLALAPVILYLIFRKVQLTERDAFLACFFFVSVPSYFLEVTGVAKTTVALIFLVLAFYIALSEIRHKYWLIGACVVAATLTHYTQGAVLGIYLIGLLILTPIIALVLRSKYTISLKKLLVATISSGLISLIFITVVAQGVVFVNVATIPLGTPPQYLGHPFPRINPYAPKDEQYGAQLVGYVQPTVSSYIKILRGENVTIEKTVPQTRPNVSSATVSAPLMTTLQEVALGLDLLKASPQGKAFRIVQMFTQLLIVLGAFWILLKRKEFKPEYLALVSTAGITLLACVFFTGYTAQINSTLWYLMALMVIAPAFIFGARLLFRRAYVHVLLALLSVYFLFTTGVVYELIKDKEIKDIDIPFSVTLSGYRLDLGSVLSRDDMDVVKEAVKLKDTPIIADFYGQFVLEEYYGKEGNWGVLGLDPSKFPNGYYLFLRERNTKERMITYARGVGLRQSFSYEYLDFDKFLSKCTLIYEKGDAKLLQYHE